MQPPAARPGPPQRPRPRCAVLRSRGARPTWGRVWRRRLSRPGSQLRPLANGAGPLASSRAWLKPRAHQAARVQGHRRDEVGRGPTGARGLRPCRRARPCAQPIAALILEAAHQPRPGGPAWHGQGADRVKGRRVALTGRAAPGNARGGRSARRPGRPGAAPGPRRPGTGVRLSGAGAPQAAQVEGKSRERRPRPRLTSAPAAPGVRVPQLPAVLRPRCRFGYILGLRLPVALPPAPWLCRVRT